jgi:hypothetical protein
LGLEINTLEIVIKIPPPKLSEVQQMLIETLNKKKITLKDLQSLAGLLNFCARAILPTSRPLKKLPMRGKIHATT